MKAREYDRRLFSRDYSVHIYSIEESNTITEEQMQLFSKNDDQVKEAIQSLYTTFYDGKLYGSIIQVPEIDIPLIEKQLEYFRNESKLDIFTSELVEYVFPLIEDLIDQYRVLVMQYEVVVTNPPYMGSKGMNAYLKKYVNKNYPDEKSDLFAVFIEVTKYFTKDNHYTATINQQSWMFLSSFEKVRSKLLKNQTVINMIHLGTRTFEEIGGEVVQNTSYILRNTPIKNFNGQYIRMVDIKNAEEKKLNFRNQKLYYSNPEINFSKIPGSPIAYWASDKIIEAFQTGSTLSDIAEPRQGLATADNNQFLRMWYEVLHNKIGFNLKSNIEAKGSQLKWFPYNKGGSFRKWYGNNEYIINWENDGNRIKNFKFSNGKQRSVIRNPNYYFKEGLTWSSLTSGNISFRKTPNGYLFDSKGPMLFLKDNNLNIDDYLMFLNSKVTMYILKLLAPTLDFNQGPIGNIPLVAFQIKNKQRAENIVKLSKSDWDSFETSWDFEEHPFLTYKEGSSRIKDSFEKWEEVAKDRFYQLKENEEELNRIFIDVYGLQDELTPEVEEKDVTVRKADRERDIKSFLSYLVGLMFGRYSLDKKGLAFAGGEWDTSLYTSYQPDENNIIPITQDQYFEDDIVKKIEELLTVIYGDESLEDNLMFIAEFLKKKATQSARERIREYFIKDFYKDHVRTYQKRPIYWQFNSGKRGAFKGLMYLHRYDKDTIGRLRTDYILQESKVLENMIGYEEQILNDDTSTQQQKARVQKIIENHMKDREELARYSEVVNHVARKQIELDLDDGVLVNYEKFQNNELVTSETTKPIKQNIFDKL